MLVDGFRGLGEGENQLILSRLSASSLSTIKDPAREDSARAGDLSITTDRLEVSNGGQISASTSGPGQGGNLKVNAKDVVLQGTGGGFASGLFVITQGKDIGSGDGGDLALTTNTLQVLGGAAIGANTFGSGRGGNLTVDVHDRLEASNGGRISASTSGSGQGGNLKVTAKDVVLQGTGGGFFSGLFVNANGRDIGSGDGGDLALTTNTLQVLGGAAIGGDTFGPGRGGDFTIDAHNILVDGFAVLVPSGSEEQSTFRSRITASSFSAIKDPAREDSARAGDISITTDRLEVSNGGRIGSSTTGPGQGGTLKVTAKDVLLQGTGGGFPSRLDVSTSGTDIDSGDSGELALTTNTLQMLGGARITAATVGPGRGGNVTVNATNIELRNGSTIRAESDSADPDAGESGSISITATDTFRLFNGSSVSVKTEQAKAGSIDLQVGNLLHLRDQGSINTSVAGGAGNGGNIFIDPVFTVLDGGSEIVARARKGSGGNIRITSDFFFQSPDSIVDASSEFSVSGTVEIDSPDIDILGGLAELPASFFDAATLLTTPCAERSGAEVSRLVIRRYEVLPDSPYALRVQLPQAILAWISTAGNPLTK